MRFCIGFGVVVPAPAGRCSGGLATACCQLPLISAGRRSSSRIPTPSSIVQGWPGWPRLKSAISTIRPETSKAWLRSRRQFIVDRALAPLSTGVGVRADAAGACPATRKCPENGKSAADTPSSVSSAIPPRRSTARINGDTMAAGVEQRRRSSGAVRRSFVSFQAPGSGDNTTSINATSINSRRCRPWQRPS